VSTRGAEKSADYRGALARWREAVGTIGFLLLLIVGSAGCGFLIAWPLWLFATAERRIFTITVAAVVVAALAAVVVRAILRRGPTERRNPLRVLALVLITVLVAAVAVAGAYLSAVLLYRGSPALGIPALVAWAGLLWLLTWLRRKVKPGHGRRESAENKSR
jgi:hypothetical protein